MKNKYLILYCIAVVWVSIICVLLTGCSRKDSGLYQIQLEGEDAEQAQLDETEPGINLNDEVVQESLEVEQGLDQDIDDVYVPIYVHVCGAVVRPGVYSMENGDRIFQVIEAAGGFAEDAARDYVNLAMELSDGMKIVIPTLAEVDSAKEQVSEKTTVEAGTTEAGDNKQIEIGVVDTGSEVSSSVSESLSSDKVNINTADSSELQTIPGIGPTRADAIIEYRNSVGLFKTIEDIKNVSGIGESTFAKLQASITVGE